MLSSKFVAFILLASYAGLTHQAPTGNNGTVVASPTTSTTTTTAAAVADVNSATLASTATSTSSATSTVSVLNGCPYNPSTVVLSEYWLPQQGKSDIDSNGQPIVLRGPKTSPLKGCDGSTIANVDATTLSKFTSTGSGRLADGRIVHMNNGTSCFEVVDSAYKWGQGSSGAAIEPFVSIAANDLPIGTTLYVSALDGLSLPGTLTKHNGCVRVDDINPSFTTCQIDWFVNSFYDYLTVNEVINGNNAVANTVVASIQSCSPISYL